MTPSNQNSIEDLVDLLLRIACNEKTGQFEVRVDLRINSSDLDAPDGTAFTVGLKRAWLKLDRSGVEIVPGERFGEPTRPNVVAVKQKTSTESVIESQAGAQADVALHANLSTLRGGAAAKVAASAKHHVAGKKVVSTTASENAAHIRVKARPAERWEVSESAGPLDGTYLNDELLCRIVARDRSNSHSVELTAYAKQKDLILNVTHNGSKFPFITPNHDKLLKILIGKALSSQGSQYDGTITFSKSESDLEK